MKLGFVVNPYAGIGGSLALKGSDGDEIRAKAIEAGAEKKALSRAEIFLRLLLLCKSDAEFYTYGGEMGEISLDAAGFDFHVLGYPERSESDAIDTIRAVSLMREAGVECVVFSAGMARRETCVPFLGSRFR
jgi:predicted polyphosphate/ATP-dependent NAD kinase